MPCGLSGFVGSDVSDLSGEGGSERGEGVDVGVVGFEGPAIAYRFVVMVDGTVEMNVSHSRWISTSGKANNGGIRMSAKIIIYWCLWFKLRKLCHRRG